jgi:two-component system phosphate regulon response regulator PhoB
MDVMHHRVTRNERQIALGPIEYRLLRFFLERPHRVFSREQMIESVWDYNINIESRTIDVHIARLRKALAGPGEPDIIRTIRSAGYALERPQADNQSQLKN